MSAKKKTESVVSEPVDVIETEPVDVAEIDETPAPVVAEPIEHAPSFRVVVAQEGDSYASIAAEYCPEGVKQRVFAQDLLALNLGKRIRPGVSVIVKVA